MRKSLNIKELFVLLILIANYWFANAQRISDVTVNAMLDTTKIKIGKQATLTLQAFVPTGTKVTFPDIKDTLLSKVDVVSQSNVDTGKSATNGQLILTKRYVITSFDSGYYAIPPQRIIINNDTNNLKETPALLLSVQTIPVDTSRAIKAIKGPIEAPWSIMEVMNELLIGAGILILLALALYYFSKRKKKPVEAKEERKFTLPPHEIALMELNKLRDEKLWQQGNVKQFHIRVSDIVRTYIEQRYNINAMEMTTDETLRGLRMLLPDVGLKNKLTQILVLSDMVKFAKESPIPNENETSIDNAFDFVKGTIILIQEPVIKEEVHS